MHIVQDIKRRAVSNRGLQLQLQLPYYPGTRRLHSRCLRSRTLRLEHQMLDDQRPNLLKARVPSHADLLEYVPHGFTRPNLRPVRQEVLDLNFPHFLVLGGERGEDFVGYVGRAERPDNVIERAALQFGEIELCENESYVSEIC